MRTAFRCCWRNTSSASRSSRTGGGIPGIAVSSVGRRVSCAVLCRSKWPPADRFSWQSRRMRADRLVATLLLLQARTRVTAAEVAAELEVSERTARRDLEALSAAGIPVYAQPGRNGGWELVGGARTDLTGLTADE